MDQRSTWIHWRLFCLAVLIGGQASGQDFSAHPPDHSTEIQFATQVFDFGRVRRGEPVAGGFAFTNTGDSLLVVSNVQPSCGCTTAGEWTRQVEPGQTGRLPFQLDTRRVFGMVGVFLRVTSNAPRQPVKLLRIQGEVRNVIFAEPPYALFELPRDAGANAFKELEITNSTGGPVGIFSPMINVTNFATELKTNLPGWDYRLIVHLRSPPAPGQAQGLITLRTTCPDQPVLVISAITVTPGSPDGNVPRSGFSAPPAGLVAPGIPVSSSAASRLEANHLHWIDDQQASAWFHDPGYQQGRIVFVDARSDQDYQAGHVPGACQYDPWHPEKTRAIVLPVCRSAEKVVVYCTGSDCEDSQMAAQALREAGVADEKLFVYVNGMSGWLDLHLPVTLPAQNQGQINRTASTP